MSIETDVSAIKRDVQQLSRTSSDFKRDIQKMKDEVSKIKDESPGPFLKIVKGAALLSAINKIDGLSDKVDTLTQTAYAKYKEARAAREAEEQRLAIAKEQDRRLKEEHETKMAFERMQNERLQKEHFERIETERLEKQQRNIIINLWAEYQRIKQEPNLLNQFFLIRDFCDKSKNICASCVKDSETLNYFSELSTCKESLLKTIKEQKGEEYFASLQEAIEIQKELHRLAHSTDYNSSHITACQGCLNTIEHIKTIIPEYYFSVEEQHTIFQKIQDYLHNSTLLASFMKIAYENNAVTENVIGQFQIVAARYRIDGKDIPEIYRLKTDILPQANDWSILLERLIANCSNSFSEDIQLFFDFVADKAKKDHYDLRYHCFVSTLERMLPGIVTDIPDETLAVFGHLDQKIMGLFQNAENQYIVFLDQSFFWFDNLNGFLVKSTYDSPLCNFPSNVNQTLESVIPEIRKLGFVTSQELVLSNDDLIQMEKKYNDYLNAEAEQQKIKLDIKNTIAAICMEYTNTNLDLRPALKLVDVFDSDLVAETTNQELVITTEGFKLKLIGFTKPFDISWESFSQQRLRLSLSSFMQQVLLDNKKTAVYKDRRYYDLLQQIVDTLYPSDNRVNSSNVEKMSVHSSRSTKIGCISLIGYLGSTTWFFFGLLLIIVGCIKYFSGDDSFKDMTLSEFLLAVSILFVVPSFIVFFLCYKSSHNYKRGQK